MQKPKYTVHQYPVSSFLEAVKNGEIVIPEIHRPFVWSSSKVRDLMENLKANCIPEGIFGMDIESHDQFLKESRKLLAEKIRVYYFGFKKFLS